MEAITQIQEQQNNFSPQTEMILHDSKSTAEEQIMKVETAKFSAESAAAEQELDTGVVRAIGGFLGALILFNSIANVFRDVKKRKLNPWSYTRVVLDFTVSGALIGYGFEHMLVGIQAGFVIGIVTLLLELKLIARLVRKEKNSK
jgi:hypothetical protein